MMGTTEAAQDISFDAMREKQEQVVGIVMADPAVQAVGSFFGGGTGQALNNGRMFISLKPKGLGKDERKDDVGTIHRSAQSAFPSATPECPQARRGCCCSAPSGRRHHVTTRTG